MNWTDKKVKTKNIRLGSWNNFNCSALVTTLKKRFELSRVYGKDLKGTKQGISAAGGFSYIEGSSYRGYN